MKSFLKISMVLALTLVSLYGFAQIKNPQTEEVNVSGNCAMCKSTIEKAGNLKNVAEVIWDKDTKIAVLTFDSNQTSEEEILKRIALAGYDSESFLAPDDAYAKLPECCQYTRSLKPQSSNEASASDHGMHHDSMNSGTMVPSAQDLSELKPVLALYFQLKDALVATDAEAAKSKAAALQEAIQAVDMKKLSGEEHSVWMAILKDVNAITAKISDAKDIAEQRMAFAALSPSMYQLVKVSPLDMPVYYQQCPMYNKGKGANWLSQEAGVKNPFYGSQMLNCGSTVETIK
ncbi:DUF3347 domain-containing protein [Algoriphagus litoralis]|uniref:DUF3347 domain-containing protein n=1 Tax=Algoriphagus litoralis TaxID=2202829 RepID=UPI000DB928E5|nr:DUF3347 domain-containing protein [Algoriphagus litoralis]